jgi:hypothetical protein
MEATVNRTELVTDLLSLPTEIARAEADLLAAQRALTNAKELLESAEAEAVLSERVDGRNAEARAAQVRRITEGPREVVRKQQDRVNRHALALRVLQARFSALRSVARLLSPEDGR